MNKELIEIAKEIVKSTLREQDGQVRVMLENNLIGDKACLSMFTHLLLPLLEMLENGPTRIGLLVKKALQMEMDLSTIMSLYKCGLLSLTPLWELAPEVQGLKLTPHGRTLAIKAVRSFRQNLVTAPDYFPPDIVEYVERLCKKYETELV